MEITQLIYFKTVAETQHITRAAAKLNISQPALSRTILRLEDSVGTMLFNREKNRIILNDAGRAFLKHAERALMEIENGRKEVLEMSELRRRRVRFSVTESGFISAPLVSYLLKNQNVHIQQYIQSTGEMRESLEKKDIDFTISFSPIESEDIEWTPLVSEEILAFAGLSHPLAQLESVSLEDLKNERFLFNNSSYNIRTAICDYCRKLGFEPDILYEGFENEVADKLVENGLGILFVPSTAYMFHFREFPPPETLAKPLHIRETIGKRVMGISRRKGYFLSKASEDCFEYLLRYFESPEGKSLDFLSPPDR